jgi:glycosyltransferase involved in cell wall biosynthesis
VRRRPVFLIVPGRLETRTGGYEYDRRMVEGLRALGWPVEVRELDGSFPQPTPAALEEAARVLAAIPDGATVLVDGLALGAMPAEALHEQRRLRLVALVHALLAAHVGLRPAVAAAREASERRALAATRMVVVTGRSTAVSLAHYAVPPERIILIEPGTDRAALARAPLRPARALPLRLLSVATISAGKGHTILVAALARLASTAWRLTVVGSVERDPEAVADLRRAIRAHDLDERVHLVGELGGVELDAQWNNADVFVLATLSETYGMAVAEALARGLPVVSTTTGAIPELVGASAGLLVPPGDPDALAGVLAQVVDDAALRGRLAAGARLARERLPTWDDAFDRMALVLERAALDA